MELGFYLMLDAGGSVKSCKMGGKMGVMVTGAVIGVGLSAYHLSRQIHVSEVEGLSGAMGLAGRRGGHVIDISLQTRCPLMCMQIISDQ